jgi:hypothetical protein
MSPLPLVCQGGQALTRLRPRSLANVPWLREAPARVGNLERGDLEAHTPWIQNSRPGDTRMFSGG